MDRYNSFSQLQQEAVEGQDFIVEIRKGASGFAVMAPHGGGIEPGTAAVANAIAGNQHSYYAFRGVQSKGNARLHLASSRFDEPRALSLIRNCHTVITVHGCKANGEIVYMGGGDTALKEMIAEQLNASGFKTEQTTTQALRGEHQYNLCNRGTRGKGVQLELPASLRDQLTGAGTGATDQLKSLSLAVGEALGDYRARLAMEELKSAQSVPEPE